MTFPTFHDGEPMFCDRAGEPITSARWAGLQEDPEYVIVRKTIVGPAEVSTVWLGLNHNAFGGRPLIFETMIFQVALTPHVIFGRVELLHEGLFDYQERYSTEQEAIQGHERAVAHVRSQVSPTADGRAESRDSGSG